MFNKENRTSEIGRNASFFIFKFELLTLLSNFLFYIYYMNGSNLRGVRDCYAHQARDTLYSETDPLLHVR